MKRWPASTKGFTLVELLIVAIMLAILAAIIVPQFASTTTEAEESALKSNLAGMRAAIDLYRQQHGEYPGAVASTSRMVPKNLRLRRLCVLLSTPSRIR